MIQKIGFGGGCHWCTEAVFQSINGVFKVDQGWISSNGENSSSSEGVIVHFDDVKVGLKLLIKIHLETHSSQSNHSMRAKYRSAIYTFNEAQAKECTSILNRLAKEYDKGLITQVLPMKGFRLNDEKYLNYYAKNKEAPFCDRYIRPKLEHVLKEFGHPKKES